MKKVSALVLSAFGVVAAQAHLGALLLFAFSLFED